MYTVPPMLSATTVNEINTILDGVGEGMWPAMDLRNKYAGAVMSTLNGNNEQRNPLQAHVRLFLKIVADILTKAGARSSVTLVENRSMRSTG